METKRAALLLVVLFSAVYYVVRIAIFLAGVAGSMDFEEEQSSLVEGVVLYSFLLIGVLGLILLPWVYLRRPLGFWGTLSISMYTILFDVWAALAVQSSAAAGILPAAVIALYLLITRKDFAAKVLKPSTGSADSIAKQ